MTVQDNAVASRQRPPQLLRTENLEVTYGGTSVAVQGVSISIGAGEVVALLGTNGAGKTTTLRAISGFLPGDRARVTDGVIRLRDVPLHDLPPHVVARRGVVLVPERDKVFTTLTVDENLRMVPSVGSERQRDEAMEWALDLFPDLARLRSKLAGHLSGGERQMLAVSRALLLRPTVLLGDEVSLGLSPILVDQLIDSLAQINSRFGAAVLLVEQNAAAAMRIADYVYVMETGRVVFDGAPAEIAEHDDVREFYLGLSAEGIKSYASVKQYKRKRRWWG